MTVSANIKSVSLFMSNSWSVYILKNQWQICVAFHHIVVRYCITMFASALLEKPTTERSGFQIGMSCSSELAAFWIWDWALADVPWCSEQPYWRCTPDSCPPGREIWGCRTAPPKQRTGRLWWVNWHAILKTTIRYAHAVSVYGCLCVEVKREDTNPSSGTLN